MEPSGLGYLKLFPQKISYPYEYFNSIDDNYKPINQPKKRALQ